MHFPKDILFEIFSYIHDISRISVLLVNKQWNRVALKVFDPSVDNNRALFWACEHGKHLVVKHLLEDTRVNPSIGREDTYPWFPFLHEYVIELSSKKGHVEIVEMLLTDERVDPSVNNSYAIQIASSNGHSAIVKLLLQDFRVDPSSNSSNHAIILASMNGHVEIVKQLLQDKRVRFTVNYSALISTMHDKGDTQIIETLKNYRTTSISLKNEKELN